VSEEKQVAGNTNRGRAGTKRFPAIKTPPGPTVKPHFKIELGCLTHTWAWTIKVEAWTIKVEASIPVKIRLLILGDKISSD
jgi:hypothetical protein